MTQSRKHIQTNIWKNSFENCLMKTWMRCEKKLTIRLFTRRHCLFTFICRNIFSPLFYLRQTVHAKFAQLSHTYSLQFRIVLSPSSSADCHFSHAPRHRFNLTRYSSIFPFSFTFSLSLSLRFEFNSECQIHVHVHVRQNLQLTAIESGYNGSSSSSPHRWDKTTNIAENQINFHWHPFVVAHILTTHIHRVQRQTRKQKNLFVSNECELRTHSRARTLNELSYVRALISHFAPARSRYYYVLFRRKWNV